MSALTRYGPVRDDGSSYIDACEGGEYVRAEEHLEIVAGLAAALRDMMELREARIRNEVIPGKSELDVLNAARSALAKAGL